MYHINKLNEHQWKTLKKIRLEALENSPDSFGSTYETESLYNQNDWVNKIKRDNHITLVASIDNGCPIGLIVGGPYDNKAGIYSMWVNSEHRGKGIASNLINTVIKWAVENQFSGIFLDVADNNQSAIMLYKRKGFIPTGLKGALPPPRDSITEIQMILNL